MLEAAGLKHCDDYILDFSAPMPLRWFLFVNRLPASEQILCRQNGVNPALFADYQGKRVRVVMASLYGDVGITKHLEAENGYQERVVVADLTNFGSAP